MNYPRILLIFLLLFCVMSNGYHLNNKLKIKISIPSTCSHKESIYRNNQRNSWIKYLSDSEWNELHSKCDIKFNYFIGNCNNQTYKTNSNINNLERKYDYDLNNYLISKESLQNNNDIIRININEYWNKLQNKTIEMILHEYSNQQKNGFNFDLLLKTDTE